MVRHGITYDDADYRAPARVGPHVVDDDEGIQQPTDHKGQVAIYMLESETGEWKELKVQFNSQGELVHVNGVRP
ncbi:hypothetical protein [Halomontanus rarus]|uniref:hypothetical protein n=1 Tax=Halomontanus rarus TaxID=3034020 RepID=UPI0023E8030A|nr:hypothetical protein [Halovivax sp. TS33]